MVTAAEEPLYLGMQLPGFMALVALISAVATALMSGLVRKFRTPTDTRQDRVVVLDASDRLIQRFEKLLKDSDDKHAGEIRELSAEVDELRKEVTVMREERSGLMGAIRSVIAIARKFGGDAAVVEIQQLDMPDSVRVH
jgi:hypothetical protein